MDYYLKADTKEELLQDLRNAGFEWYDYDEFAGTKEARDPNKHEVITVRHLGSCIYLEHLVEESAVFDQEGNLLQEAVITPTFHANVRMDNPHSFATDMGVPTQPQFGWA